MLVFGRVAVILVVGQGFRRRREAPQECKEPGGRRFHGTGFCIVFNRGAKKRVTVSFFRTIASVSSLPTYSMPCRGGGNPKNWVLSARESSGNFVPEKNLYGL